MEGFIFFVIGSLMLVAWGLALFGVPILFRRVRSLENQLIELTSKQSHEQSVGAITSVSEQKNDTENAPDPQLDKVEQDYEASIRDAFFESAGAANPEAARDENYEKQAKETDPKEFQDSPEPLTQEPHKPSWLERQFSTHLTAKIGAIVLIFGAVFLAKYTADIGLFSLTARLWTMGVAGIVIAILGVKLNSKRALYGHILQGTGLAIWLATWFASHVIYQQVGWIITLIACVLAVLIVGYRAIKQDSQVLAFIALVGGFIAPFIASSEASSLWRLFAYLIILNAGTVWIAKEKAWKWFVRLGYLGSLLLVSLLMTAEYLQGDLANAAIQRPFLFFVSALLILYSLLAAKWVVSGNQMLQLLLPGLVITVPGMVSLAVYGLFKDNALLTATIYLSFAIWYSFLWFKTAYKGFAATAIVAASVAVPFALNDLFSSLVYSIEGAAFFAYAVRQQRWLYLAWASLLQAAAAVFAILLFTDSEVLANSIYLAWPLFGAVIVAGLYSGWTLFSQASFEKYNQLLQRAWFAWSLFWWLYLWGFFSAEVFSKTVFLTICVGLMPLTLAMVSWAKQQVKWPVLIEFHYLYTMLAVAAAIVFYAELGSTASIYENLMTSALLVGYWFKRILLANPEKNISDFEGLVLWFVYPLSVGLLISNLTQMHTDWNIVGLSLPFVLLFAVHEKVLPLIFGSSKQQTNALYWSIGVVMLGGVGSLMSVGNYAPWPFVAILHPLSLMALLLGYKLVRLIRLTPMITVPSVFWCALMLTIEINRILFHYIGINYDIEAWLSSALTQMVWSLVWSLVGAALMLVGARRNFSRRVWASGAIALGVVVLKLFILDLSNVDTLFRILSFIGVGGLLLAVGYFAPLPLSTPGDAKE